MRFIGNYGKLYLIYEGIKSTMEDEKMDIKEMISELVEKVTSDDSLMDLFKEEPVKAIEKVLGVDLPDDVVEKIIDGVKAKITVDSISDIAGKLKKLF